MVREFEPPTYEQYKSATKFAKFRYKYGLFVQLLAVFLLCLLILFIWNYGQELAQHPLTYATEKTNSICNCKLLNSGEIVKVNATHIIKLNDYAWGLID